MDVLMDAGEAMPAMGVERPELVMCMPHFAVKVWHAINPFEVLFGGFTKTFDGENALLRFWFCFGSGKVWREGDVLKDAFDNGQNRGIDHGKMVEGHQQRPVTAILLQASPTLDQHWFRRQTWIKLFGLSENTVGFPFESAAGRCVGR